MRQLNENFDLDTCQTTVNEFNVKFVEKDAAEVARMRQHQIMNLNYQLEAWSTDIHLRLQNIFKRMMSHGIENSKSVIEAGLLIQSEAATYILTYTQLCQSLCCKQLVLSWQKISDLEKIIGDEENFAVQMNGDLLLMDELLTEIGFCGHVVDFMAKFNLVTDKHLSNCLTGFVNVYKQFKNLIGSYFAIILQEGLKNCQREDGAMEQAAKQINDIIKESDPEKFRDLIQNLNSNTGSMTSGQMMIMAMNSLLENVDNALKHTRFEQDMMCQQEKNWSSRMECIADFFNICFRSMNSFKADKIGQLFPSGDELGYPIIKYMAKYYLRHFRGRVVKLLSHIVTNTFNEASDVDDLDLTEMVNQNVEVRFLEARDKGQFLTLEMNAIFSNLRKIEMALNLEFKVEILNANQQINQLQRNSFQWYHEDSLPMQVVNAVQPLRPQILNDLKNCVTALITTQKELIEINTRYQDLSNTVEQRLKWACGANPDLQEVFDKFSSSFSAEMEAMRSMVGISKSLSASANTIVHYESLRTTSRESLAADSAVMSLFAECQQSVQLQESQAANHELGSLELEIFSMNPPEDLIDKKWIKTTGESVTKQIRGINKEIGDEKEKMKATQQDLQTRISDFKKTLITHQKLMADVGALLRSIDKAEELEVPEIKTYLAKYRDFTDKIASMFKKLADDFTDDKVDEISTEIDGLKEVIPAIYDDLISLAVNLKYENIEKFRKPGREDTNTNTDTTSTNIAEEKNTFALSVLRRVKTKLDGREPDVLRKATVAEQVDFIIREATNVDNLALLYEGWTAWI